ncbi:hotdog domain-containing protein [Providencia manganoxydans]|uniref:hotdog domain-containing protein n=1 Tax=Providencia manganoxydans TaxID=2923283 RepID=UPI0034E40E35
MMISILNTRPEIALGRVVTVAVNGIKFQKPVAVGDVVCCYARCLKTGKSSITINIEVWVKKVATEPVGQRYRATDAVFTYVAVTDDNTARELPKDKQHFQLESTE